MFLKEKLKEGLAHATAEGSLIIGKSLESLLYAWKTQQRCILLNPLYVFRYDKNYSEYNFDFMNAKDAKAIMDQSMFFTMSMSSLLLFPDNVQSIRESKYGIDVFTKGSKIKQINHKNVQYFDEKADNLLNVYDFFDTRSMKVHDKWEILGDDDFVNRINFYVSPRVDKGTTKDFVASSVMTPEQLLNPDWGNGIVKKLKAAYV